MTLEGTYHFLSEICRKNSCSVYMEKAVFFPNTLFSKPQINTEIRLKSLCLPALQPQLLHETRGRNEEGLKWLYPRYASWHFLVHCPSKRTTKPHPAGRLMFHWPLLGLPNRNQMNLQVCFQTKPISNNGFSFAEVILEWAFNVFRAENVSQTHCKVGSAVSLAFAVCAGIRFPD